MPRSSAEQAHPYGTGRHSCLAPSEARGRTKKILPVERGRTLRYRGLLRSAAATFLIIRSLLSAAQETSGDDMAKPLAFTAVEPPEAFALPGSLSNAWADFDGDGDPDLAVSTKSGEIRLYRNEAGRLINVGASLGLPVEGDEIRGLAWGDFDADGDPDLFAGSNVSPIPTRSYLFRNEGGEGFVEMAAEVGVTAPGRFSRQANWIDVDNDGDLDLYTANRAGLNRLYRAENSGFKQEGYGRGTVDPRRTVGACWFDYDRDGDLDLFLANQNGDSDALWRNHKGEFEDIAPALGLDQTQRTLPEGGVGCAPGDFDNDGDLDLYVGTYGTNLLYVNDGRGGFQEQAEARGLAEPHSVVGAAWGDYDNDGDLDLFLAAYERVDGVQQPRDQLLRNDDGRFVNILPESHPMNAADHGVEWLDYDGDGDVDLSLTDGYGDVGGHPVFRNELVNPALGRGFAVRPLGAEGRLFVPGAEVEVVDDEGRRGGLRLASTGGGYNAQSVVPVHVVAPPDALEVFVEVRYPGEDGGETVRVGPFATEALAGRVIDVRRGAGASPAGAE